MSKNQSELYDIKVILRFVDKVKEGENDCLEWTGALNADGYGQISIGNREEQTKVKAHRWALGFALGGIVLPPEILSCHHCDNAACVNPIHLFPGTNQDNMDDMVAKGRSASGCLANQGARKLTDEEVIEIRHSTESRRVLSAKHGVSKSTVSQIKNRVTWKEL